MSSMFSSTLAAGYRRKAPAGQHIIGSPTADPACTKSQSDPDYVPNDIHEQVAQLIGNFRALRTALDEICAINTELLRRREELG